MLTAACNHSPASLKNRNHKQGGGGEAAKDTKDRKACREFGGGERWEAEEEAGVRNWRIVLWTFPDCGQLEKETAIAVILLYCKLIIWFFSNFPCIAYTLTQLITLLLLSVFPLCKSHYLVIKCVCHCLFLPFEWLLMYICLYVHTWRF